MGGGVGMDSTNSIMANKLKLLGVSNTVLIEKAGFELKGNEETIKRNGKLNYTGIVRQAYDYITSNIDSLVSDENARQLWRWFDKSKINGGRVSDLVLQYSEVDIIEGVLKGVYDLVYMARSIFTPLITKYFTYGNLLNNSVYREYVFNGRFWEINDLGYIPSGICVKDIRKHRLASIKFIYGGCVRYCFEKSVINKIDCGEKVIWLSTYNEGQVSDYLRFQHIKLRYEIDDKGIDMYAM